MIDINTAANIAEIGGGIAILVSLVYVGYQIRHSNRIARADGIRSTYSMAFMHQFNMADIGRAFNEFSSLDYDAKWDFHVYFLTIWGHWITILDSKRLGLVSEEDLTGWLHVMAGIVTTRGVLQYFEEGGSKNLMPHGLKLIEDHIKKNSETVVPYNEQFKWMVEAK
jgi:hypothetical protein